MNAFTRSLIPPLAGALVLLSACSQQSADELITAAQSNIQKKETKTAIIQLKLAIDKNGNLSEARYLLGKTLIETGESAAAIIELRKALELGHPAATVTPALATAMLAEQSYQKIISEFEATKLSPELANSELKTTVATAYALTGNTQKAKELANQVLKETPKFPPALLLLARVAIEVGNLSEAKSLNDQLIQIDSNDPMAWTQRGEILVLAEKDSASPEGAIAAYRNALKIEPTHYLARSGLLVMLFRKNDLQGAELELAELKRHYPNHPQSYAFTAQLALSKKDIKKAKESIENALKLAPDNTQILLLSGGIELTENALIQAERTFAKIVSLQPNSLYARHQLAVTHLRLGQPSKALTALQPLLTASRTSAETYALAGEANLQLGNLVQSQAKFSDAVKLDPSNVNHRIQLALTKRSESGGKVTTSELREIASTDKSPAADLALINFLINTKAYPAAMLAVDSLEKKTEGRALPHLLRGRINLQLNQSKLARENFEKALSIDPVYIPAAGTLAALNLTEGKLPEAKRIFDRILAINPNNLDALLAIAKLKVIEKSPAGDVIAALQNAIKLNPGEAQPRLMLVNYLLQQKDIKAALNTAQAANTQIPNNPEILDSLGRSLRANGDTQQAISVYTKILGITPNSGKILIQLAATHLANKDARSAEQSLKRAAEFGANLAQIQSHLIDIALADNRPHDAITLAKALQDKYPRAEIGYDAEAGIYIAQKRLDSATNVYRVALKKHPQSAFAQRLHANLVQSKQGDAASELATTWIKNHPNDAAFLGYLAQLAMIQNQPAPAEQYLRMLLKIQPSHVGALNNLALALAHQKKPGASQYAEQALKIQPNVPGLLDTKATALASEGNVDGAITTQLQAIALAPDDMLLKLTLARLYTQKGDQKSADKELQQLKKLGDSFAGHAEVDRLLTPPPRK